MRRAPVRILPLVGAAARPRVRDSGQGLDTYRLARPRPTGAFAAIGRPDTGSDDRVGVAHNYFWHKGLSSTDLLRNHVSVQ